MCQMSCYGLDIEKSTMLKSNVLVEVFNKKNQSASGIVIGINDNNAFIPDRGIVVNVCAKGNIYDLKVGDKVVIKKYSGVKMTNEKNQTFILMNVKDVIATLDEDADVNTYYD